MRIVLSSDKPDSSDQITWGITEVNLEHKGHDPQPGHDPRCYHIKRAKLTPSSQAPEAISNVEKDVCSLTTVPMEVESCELSVLATVDVGWFH